MADKTIGVDGINPYKVRDHASHEFHIRQVRPQLPGRQVKGFFTGKLHGIRVTVDTPVVAGRSFALVI
mgnify:CR=1 FL=1